MPYLDNPAGRLRHWLEMADHSPRKEDALIHAWADLLGLERDTPQTVTAVLRHAAALGDLCRDVRAEAARLPELLHPELLLVDFHQVERAVGYFTQARQVRLEQLLAQIEPTGHRGLELLDTYLHSYRAEKWMGGEVRDSLIDDVRALVDGIASDDSLDLDVKEFILSRLQEVETALRDAELTGTRAIETATDSLIGAMHRRPDLWDRVAGTKWGKRLATFAGALCLALSSAGGLPALMPGDEPQPDVTNIELTITNVSVDNEDVVDAELVGPDEGRQPGEH